MWRIKLKNDKQPVVESGEDNLESKQEVVSMKRKWVASNDNETEFLQSFVFGAGTDFSEKLEEFGNDLKFQRNDEHEQIVEKVSKWEDTDGIAVTKLSMEQQWVKSSEESLRSDGDESNDNLARRTGNFLMSSDDLPSNVLDIKTCTNANKKFPSKGKLRSVEFLHTDQVMLTAGMDNTLRLFRIDGKENPSIGKGITLEKFPIFKAHFTKDGSQVIMGSCHQSFHIFDLGSDKLSRVCIKGLDCASNSKNFVLSPDGKLMCLVGQSGYLHLLSVKTRELVHTFHMNGPAEAVCFNNDGSMMLSHGDDGEVFVWDINSRTCKHKFIDEGCTKGTSLAVSYEDHYVATGSYSGVVNIYDKSCFESRSPKPLKAIMNLTSACTSMAFNSTAEILAIASNYTDGAVKLVHLPTQTVFSNFPKQNNHICIPMDLDFSPNSGYLTIGNNKGKALLYRLQHYSDY